MGFMLMKVGLTWVVAILLLRIDGDTKRNS